MDTVFHTPLPASPALALQCCAHCGQVNYPARELCGCCLGDTLEWRPVADTGVVQSLTELHYSLEPAYATHLPWTVASVRLDCGPVVLAHLAPGVGVNGRVGVRVIRNRAGTRMLLAAGTDPAARAAASNWLARVDLMEVDT